MYLAIAVLIVAVDQLLKYLVRAGLGVNDVIPVFGDFLTITLHYNTGAAFSMLEGSRIILTIVPLVMIIAMSIFVLRTKDKSDKMMSVALSMIIGGGAGNLIDRIVWGKVTDFISVGTFPIFNLADMCVVVGCGLMFIYVIFFGKDKSETK